MRLVRKYAYAFYNVYGNNCTLSDIHNYEKAADFLYEHPRALFLLQVPRLSADVKHEGLALLCERFSLPEKTHDLIRVLLKDGAAHLIADIFMQLVDIYKEQRGVHNFVIRSSSQLSDSMRAVFEKFIAERVEGTILYRYVVDKNLIAGVRLQSETYLWEYSLNKQLRTLNYSWIR